MLVGTFTASSVMLSTPVGAAAVDQCAIFSPATITKLLNGQKAVGVPTKRATGYCGWHSAGSPIPATSGSILYFVYPNEAAAKKMFQLFAGLSNEKKISGVGDKAVVSDRANLAAISARKGALFLHIESLSKGPSSKPLINLAKSVFATGHA